MSHTIRIAVDAMGGDNSPEKVIHGISFHSKNSSNCIYKIFGDEKPIKGFIDKYSIKCDATNPAAPVIRILIYLLSLFVQYDNLLNTQFSVVSSLTYGTNLQILMASNRSPTFP